LKIRLSASQKTKYSDDQNEQGAHHWLSRGNSMHMVRPLNFPMLMTPVFSFNNLPIHRDLGIHLVEISGGLKFFKVISPRIDLFGIDKVKK